MKRSLLLVLSLVSFFVLVIFVLAVKKVEGRGNRKPSAISDDIYDALFLLVKGDSLPPVKERNRAQTSADISLCRSRSQLSIRQENSKDVLFYKNL